MGDQRRMPNIAETTTRGSPSLRLVLPGQPAGSKPLPTNGNLNRAGPTRRYSLAPSVSASTRKLSSSATTTQNGAEPVQAVENTFQLEPQPGCHFNANRVERILHALMEAMLDGVEYDADAAPDLARTLAEDAKARVKLLKYERHKVVVHVILGSMKGQGMQTVSRSVWDHQFDNYASACFHNRSMFAVAMVHATYFE